MFVSLSRPPLLPGHRPWFSLGPVGPRPGTPGRAPALRARGLPAPGARSPQRGRCPAPLSAEPRPWVPNGLARARWGKVPRLVRGHPGRAFLDHPVGTLRCSSLSVLTLFENSIPCSNYLKALWLFIYTNFLSLPHPHQLVPGLRCKPSQ